MEFEHLSKEQVRLLQNLFESEFSSGKWEMQQQGKTADEIESAKQDYVYSEIQRIDCSMDEEADSHKFLVTISFDVNGSVGITADEAASLMDEDGEYDSKKVEAMFAEKFGFASGEITIGDTVSYPAVCEDEIYITCEAAYECIVTAQNERDAELLAGVEFCLANFGDYEYADGCTRTTSVEQVNENPLVILCGKSAVGKDTVQKELEQRGFGRVISATTRPMREGEQDGVEYHFMTDEQFNQLLKEDGFIENVQFNGNQYGCPKSSVDSSQQQSIVLELHGARAFMEMLGRENIFIVSLELPESVRKQRAEQRSPITDEEWAKRCASDAERFPEAEICDLANFRLTATGTVTEIADNIISALDAYKDRYIPKGEKCVIMEEESRAFPNDHMEQPRYVYKAYLQSELDATKSETKADMQKPKSAEAELL